MGRGAADLEHDREDVRRRVSVRESHAGQAHEVVEVALEDRGSRLLEIGLLVGKPALVDRRGFRCPDHPLARTDRLALAGGDRDDDLKRPVVRGRELAVPDDIQLDAEDVDMPDIIFSHEKHAVWNGCELCHPQIFDIKKSSTVFEMQEIFDGRYCGACHGKVAFTNMDCQLCHSGEIY